MPYQIGKVFSDSVLDRLASRAEARGGHGGTVTQDRRGKGAGGGGAVEAARIRADTADKDRAARVAGQQATLGQRQAEAQVRQGESAGRARARAIAANAEAALAQVKTARDGLRLIGWLESKAREKDAYGRIDPELVQAMAPLIQEARRRLVAPTAEGGLGLPDDGISDAATRAISGMTDDGSPSDVPDLGGGFLDRAADAIRGAGATVAGAAKGATRAAVATVGSRPTQENPLQHRLPAADSGDDLGDTSWTSIFDTGEKPPMTR